VKLGPSTSRMTKNSVTLELAYLEQPCTCNILNGDPHHHTDPNTVIPWKTYLNALNEYAIEVEPRPGVEVQQNVMPQRPLPHSSRFYCESCELTFTVAGDDPTCDGCGGLAKPIR
jgi:hypothetical protein